MITGLYFGSFNPIHNGHLAIANYVLDYTVVDELWFVVSPQNPLKAKELLAPDFHRLEMVKRAISETENRMKVCDIEMSLPKPSFTIDTLLTLEKKYPQKKFYLILGSDSMETITKWKEYDKLLKNYSILVYPREGSNLNDLIQKYPIKIVNALLVDFSSTTIRQRLNNGLSVSDFIPESVAEYITEHGLFKTT